MADNELRFVGGIWYPPQLGRWRMTGPLAVLTIGQSGLTMSARFGLSRFVTPIEISFVAIETVETGVGKGFRFRTRDANDGVVWYPGPISKRRIATALRRAGLTLTGRRRDIKLRPTSGVIAAPWRRRETRQLQGYEALGQRVGWRRIVWAVLRSYGVRQVDGEPARVSALRAHRPAGVSARTWQAHDIVARASVLRPRDRLASAVQVAAAASLLTVGVLYLASFWWPTITGTVALVAALAAGVSTGVLGWRRQSLAIDAAGLAWTRLVGGPRTIAWSEVYEVTTDPGDRSPFRSRNRGVDLTLADGSTIRVPFSSFRPPAETVALIRLRCPHADAVRFREVTPT